MSLIPCTECDRIIDSDDDPECFVERTIHDPDPQPDWVPLCTSCRQDPDILAKYGLDCEDA